MGCLFLTVAVNLSRLPELDVHLETGVTRGHARHRVSGVH